MLIIPLQFVSSLLAHRPGHFGVICAAKAHQIPVELTRDFLHIPMDDLTCDQVERSRSLEAQVESGKFSLPGRNQVALAIQFGAQFAEDAILVTCDAGISRSSSIAWAIYLQKTRSPRLATELLFDGHKQAMPNRDVVRHAVDLVLGDTGLLVTALALIREAETPYSATA